MPAPKLTFPADEPALFFRAVGLLDEYLKKQRPALLASNFAVAIAALIHRNLPIREAPGPDARIFLPSTGPAVSTLAFQQHICDQTFNKDPTFLPRKSAGPIYKPFTRSFKPPSPRTNNWRNSFDLQAGLGCDAPYDVSYLRSEAFLAEPRFDCAFRNPKTGKCLSPAGLTKSSRTCFNPNKRGLPPGPDSTAALRTKLFTRGKTPENEAGFWIVEPTHDVIAGLIASPDNRVPLFPFLSAVYSGSSYFEAWGKEISRERLERDLRLTPQNFAAIFDPNPSNLYNEAFLSGSKIKAAAYAAASKAKNKLSGATKFRRRDPGEFKHRAEQAIDEAERLRLLEKASHGHARATNALANQLQAAGFEVVEQTDGFDLYATEHLFEVKTWNGSNLRSQIRHAVAQLYEYRWRNRETIPDTVNLYLVLDRAPPGSAPPWIWEYLIDDRGVIPCWIENNKVTTFKQYKHRFAWLYEN